MKPKRIFISFDFDEDKSLKDLLIGQSKNPETPFEIFDHSLKEAEKEKDWEERARHKISQADEMIVLVGHATHRAPGVQKEVRIARELGKKVVQLVGHPDGKCKRVQGAGVLYRWTWDNLKKILG